MKTKTEMPREYLTGRTKFLNCPIDLSLRPLIPRKETAFWTKKAIADIGRRLSNKTIRCLDIFSGSGCIGIAVLKKTKNTLVDFAEADKKFLKQIKINLRLNEIKPARYKIIRSDIFQSINKKYDYILANPPYISISRKYLVQKSVLDFEPAQALFTTENGLFYIKKFLQRAKKHLKKSGKIYLEFDHFHKKELEKLLMQFGYENFRFFKDQYKKWRFVICR